MLGKQLVNGLWNSRAQLLLVMLILVVLSIGQGRELSLSLQASTQSAPAFAVLSVGWFVLQIWLWTYVSVLAAPVRSHIFSVWLTDEDATVDPGGRATASFLAAGYSGIILLFLMCELLRIGEATTALSLAFTNVLIVMYVVVVAKRTLRDQLSIGAMNLPSGIVAKIREIGLRHPRYARLDGATTALLAASLISSVVLGVAWIALPDSSAYLIGSLGSVFLSLAILAPWPFLIFLLAQGRRIPILSLLLVCPFIFEMVYAKLGLHQGLYAVRELADSKVADRPTLDAALTRWREQEKSRPVIFVTAAGGGIRAAFWTAAVLGRLQDCIPGFHNSVFSISSVSGGSLGAAAFVTLVAGEDKVGRARSICDPPIGADDVRQLGYHQDFLRSFLSQDYLAPVMREMLLSDIGRSLVPWVSDQSSAKDRGVALEQAWERAWDQACAAKGQNCSGRPSLKSSFSSLGSSTRWSPLLLLNGVHEESGKRLITSTARVDTAQFVDATDFFDLLNHDVRTSTAVLNSARFPIISPSGALLRKTEDPETGSAVRQLMGHVIDGGYFDNNGTITAQESASFVVGKLGIGTSRGSCGTAQDKRRTIFIEILNDTTMSELDADRGDMSSDVGLADRIQELANQNMDTPFQQLLTVIRGLESSRGSRAVHASKTLARFSKTICNGYYFELPLCTGILPQPALGWTLSEDSRSAMDQLLIGGIDHQRYKGTKTSRDFYDCYAHIQRKISAIARLLAINERK